MSLLLASDRLSRAQLDFEARRYEFRDMADLAANFAPSLALTAIIETRPTPGRKDGYVLIAAPDWVQAMQLLFGEWTPEPEQRPARARAFPRSGGSVIAEVARCRDNACCSGRREPAEASAGSL